MYTQEQNFLKNYFFKETEYGPLKTYFDMPRPRLKDHNDMSLNTITHIAITLTISNTPNLSFSLLSNIQSYGMRILV